MCDSFNGWTNRETWALMLYVENDGLSEGLRDTLAEHEFRVDMDRAMCDWAESIWTRAGYVGMFGDEWPDVLADEASDIGSLYRVNWTECVNAIMESE